MPQIWGGSRQRGAGLRRRSTVQRDRVPDRGASYLDGLRHVVIALRVQTAEGDVCSRCDCDTSAATLRPIWETH